MEVMKKPEALVVLSGGQDSTTCLFWAVDLFSRVYTVSFNYGQRHAAELKAARQVAALAGIPESDQEIIDLGPILKGTSPLTNNAERLETYSDFASMDKIIGDRVEKTFVPMRNQLFLTIAANRAVCLGVKHMVTGVCEADNANYPDCRESFIGSLNTSINLALGLGNGADDGLTIHAPLMRLSKARSIQLALKIGGAYEALAFSHTAYSGEYPPVTQDHASVLRAHGFEEAGVPDPLILRAVSENRMGLPASSNYHNLQWNEDVTNRIFAAKHQLDVKGLL